MSIWFNKNLSLDDFASWPENTMSDHLGMKFIEIGSNYLKLSMPVNEKTKQPYGLLHGGASVALAETVGSMASMLVIDPTKFICVGIEINANHTRGVREGVVIGTCTPLHLGRTSHVWDIKIHDGNNKLTCISRLTVAVLDKKNTIS